jgi:hypothetical protein
MIALSGCRAIVTGAPELALVGQPGYSAYSGNKGAMLARSRTLVDDRPA